MLLPLLQNNLLDTQSDVTVDVDGAAAAAQAGGVDVPLGTIKRLAPIVLPLAGYVPRITSLTVDIPSASAGAAAGNVSALTSNAGTFAQLGPRILPSPLRSISPKVGNVTVDLVGAEAAARAEQMEGADVVMYIDGASAAAGAGVLVFTPTVEPERFASVVDIDLDVRDMQMILAQVDTLLTAQARSVEIKMMTRTVSITGSTLQSQLEPVPSGGVTIR